MRYIADIADTEFLTIGDVTQMGGFNKELRWNELYYLEVYK